MNIKLSYSVQCFGLFFLMFIYGYFAEVFDKLDHWGLSFVCILIVIIIGLEFKEYNVTEKLTRSEYQAVRLEEMLKKIGEKK